MTTTPTEQAVVTQADCGLCRFPKHRHNGGFPNTCPIIATYRPATPPTTPARVDEGALYRLRHFADGTDWRIIYNLAVSPDPSEWLRRDIAAMLALSTEATGRSEADA